MQVYIELAFAENFCMDFALLYCAKLLSKNNCSFAKIAFSSVFGACFAVAFPLFNITGILAIAIKLFVGAVLVLLCGRFNFSFGMARGIKSYIKFLSIFLAITFMLGGCLIALFNFAGIAYSEGSGYIISSIPIGIPIFSVLVLALFVKRLAKNIRARIYKKNIKLHIYLQGKCVVTKGFYDSGNNVYCCGQPVSVVPEHIAKKLVDVKGIKNFVDVHTVSGSNKMPIFTADRVEIDNDEGVITFSKVIIGISQQVMGMAVIHPDMSE